MALCGERNVFNKLVESTRHVPEDHPRLSTIFVKPSTSATVCPFFDGNLAVNLGTMGVLGELLFNWSVEIRSIRTANNAMSLLGVTDSQHKMAEIGIVLNAVLLSGRYRFHEHHVTLYRLIRWRSGVGAAVGTSKCNGRRVAYPRLESRR